MPSDHSIETYKSLVALGQFALKFALAVNGGAAVALLAFMGDVALSLDMLPHVGPSLRWFIGGLTLAGFAICTAYLTQLALYNESKPRQQRSAGLDHRIFLYLSIVLTIASVVAFSMGCFDAVASYEALFKFREYY